MIPVTSPQQAVLEGRKYREELKVEIKDAGGTYLDYSDYAGLNLQVRAEVTVDVDARIKQATIELVRQDNTNSLAPLLNSDIAVGRAVRISAARVALGMTPGPSDFHPLFEGSIDEWGHPTVSGVSDENRLLLVARDNLAAVQDRIVKDETIYGAVGGTALEAVMQAILDDWADGIELYVPVATGIAAGEFAQQKGSVLDALQSLADLIGWVIEDRWDSGTGAWRITLYEPNRAAVATDWTFGPSDYFEVTQLYVQRYHIRNIVRVEFFNADTEERDFYQAQDDASIAKYGERYMEIVESDDSPINSQALAQGMADPAVSDLAEPDAVQQIKGPLFYPVQLGDFYGFDPNSVHYDVAQAFGVTGYTHTLENGVGTTAIRTRGKPTGSVRGWLKRSQKPRPPGQAEDDLKIYDFKEIGRTPTEVTYGWKLGGGLQQSWIHDYIEQQPYADDRWPGPSRVPDAISLDREPTYTLQIPEQGYVRYFQVEGRTADLSVGAVERALFFPSNIQGDFIAFLAVKVKQSDGSAEIRGWATDRARSVSVAWNVGAADRPAPTVTDAENQGGGADNGTLITGFTSDFYLSLPAGTVDFGETIKVTAVAYIFDSGTGADGTVQDHGPPVGAQDERIKITLAEQLEDSVVISRKMSESARKFGFTGTFAPADWDEVEWTTGALTLMGDDGITYTIVSGSTGSLTDDLKHYIFFNKATSTTVLQVTDDLEEATEEGAILIAVVRRALTNDELAFLVSMAGDFALDGSHINPYSIDTAHLRAEIIETVHIDAVDLSALGARIYGTLHADVIIASDSFTASNAVFDGAAEFYGSASGAQKSAVDATQYISVNAGGDVVAKIGDFGSGGKGHIRAPSGELIIDARTNIVLNPSFTPPGDGGNVYVNSDLYVSGVLILASNTVSFGASNSGGTGYRQVLVPN